VEALRFLCLGSGGASIANQAAFEIANKHMLLPPDILLKFEELVGFSPVELQGVQGGYSPAKRFIARNGSRSAFIKFASTPTTARALNREIEIYQTVSGSFVPKVIGWHVDQTTPILILEDLSKAYWPPPWSRETTTLVLDQVAAMHSASVGSKLRNSFGENWRPGWPVVAQDPTPFLSLGLVSAAWLERALPRLIEAECKCETNGSSLTHMDLRSDNICIHDGVVKIIDWSDAGTGSARLDLAFMLPSLSHEGGPVPDELLPSAPHEAALVSGYFASRAGLPVLPDAPFVRRVQREQLATALPWVQRQLGLPALAS
jgi:Phosphotransferase enzyme family